jgi:hypothetical protein
MDRNRARFWCLGVLLAGTAGVVADERAPASLTAQRRLLEVAEQRGPAAVGEAKRRFESARAIVEDDRPVRYAHGVVLVRLLKPKEALTEFQAAATSERGPYPPALRAAIFLGLSGRDGKSAEAFVRRFGDALVNAPDAWTTDAAWSTDARWLGEAVSTAQLILSTASDVKTWSDVDQDLRSTLPEDLRTAYATGFEAVLERHAVLAAKVESVQKDALLAEGEKNEAVRKEVLDAKQKVAAQKENLKVAAGDWKKLYDDQMTEFSKQLGKLEKDWNSLDNRRQSLERSILLTQQEISLMLQQIDQINSQQTNSQISVSGLRVPSGLDLRQTYNQQLGQRQAALIQYQFDWNRTVGQQNQMQQQAVGLVKQQQAAVADYQQRTGQLVQQDGQLDKWNKRLNEQASDLEDPPTGKTAQTRSLQQKLKSAATYLPWDWEAERQRLLKGTEVAKASSGE